MPPSQTTPSSYRIPALATPPVMRTTRTRATTPAPSRPPARPSSRVARGLTVALVLAFAFGLGLDAASPAPAAAARVSGTLTGYQGQPEPSRDLHFENCVTQDEYLAPTHSDSSFAQSLPPGCYDLRAERGAILRHGIIVGDQDVAIGAVSDLAPLAPARLFNLEELFPTLLTSPAPSTAYIFTHDPTVVPASAAVVAMPSSESEWLKLQKQTAGATNPEPSGPAYNFNEPMDFTPPSPGAPQPSLPPTEAPIPPQP
jgi:hypothetical protein